MKHILVMALVLVALVSVGCTSCPQPAPASATPVPCPSTCGTTHAWPWDNDGAAMKQGWIWQQGGKDFWKKPCVDPCCPDGSCEMPE